MNKKGHEITPPVFPSIFLTQTMDPNLESFEIKDILDKAEVGGE